MDSYTYTYHIHNKILVPHYYPFRMGTKDEDYIYESDHEVEDSTVIDGSIILNNIESHSITKDEILQSTTMTNKGGRHSKASSRRSSTSSTPRAKTFFCDYNNCQKSFTRPSLLTEHQMATHQGIRSFSCNQCDKSFVRKNHLERHLLTHLDERDKPFHCEHCNKGFTTTQQLKRHEITHTKSFRCSYRNCSESFYKHPQLRSHIMSVHLKSLNCDVCGKSFQRPYRLKHHMAKYHDPNNLLPYSCSMENCFKSFKIWSALQNHIKKDHPKLSCPICHKLVVGETGLQMHMKIHDDSIVKRKNWSCNLCSINFVKKHDLIDHYKATHPEISLKTMELLDPSTKNPPTTMGHNNIPQTIITAKTFPINNEVINIQNQVSLQKYLDNENNSSVKLLLNTVGRKLQCPYDKCYRTFKTQERFETHIQKHKIHQLKLKLLQEKELTEKANSTNITNLDDNASKTIEENTSNADVT